MVVKKLLGSLGLAEIPSIFVSPVPLPDGDLKVPMMGK